LKISKEDIAEILEVFDDAEAFRPVIKKVLDVLTSFGPEIEVLPKNISKWFVQNRIESVKAYMAVGFTTEQAIDMTMDDVMALKRAIRSIKTKEK